jgi:hypothetical protein
MSGAVLLDGPTKPGVGRVQTLGSGLAVVTDRRIAYTCLVPGCASVFYEGEDRAYHAHVTRCALNNEQDLRERDLGHQMPGMFGPDAGDVEKKTWYRERKGWRV